MTADVAIVGYGPVGATLANVLGQAGIDTAVHESSTDAYPLPRACHLDAEIMRVFQSVGLAAGIDRLVEPSWGMVYVDSDLVPLFTYEDFTRDPILGWHEDYVFIQPELDAALRRGVDRFDCVRVHLGSTVATVEELDARFVVACDGAQSTLRRQLGVPLVDHGFDERWLVVDVMLQREVELPAVIQQICHPERAATFVPSARNHRRWEFRLGGDESDDEAVAPQSVWARLARWLDPDDTELVRTAVYEFHAVVADSWRRGDVFLAGDAAHQMPPFMGQGMCSGIRDAANLGWKLAAVLNDGAGAGLLDSYEIERRDHVERCIELSVEAGRLVSSSPPDFPPGDVDDGERWSRLPPITGGVLQAPAIGAVGHQARQPTVEYQGETLLLDDVAGPGWYLLTREGAPSSDFATVVSAAELGDPSGWLARLLGGHHAVLIRPDHYIYGCAATVADIAPLLAAARSDVWG